MEGKTIEMTCMMLLMCVKSGFNENIFQGKLKVSFTSAKAKRVIY